MAKLRPGRKFGLLEVMTPEQAGTLASQDRYVCVCRCGRQFTVRSKELLSGQVTCGCARKDSASVMSLSVCEREAYAREIHRKMIEVATANSMPVETTWLQFEKFIQDVGYPAHEHSFWRKDPLKGFVKDNCHWRNRCP